MALPFYPLIGIDIGTSAIKIAEVSGSGQRRKLAALGLELLPAEAVIDGLIQDQEAVEKALITLLDRLKINPGGRRAAIAMNAQSVEVKRLLIDTSAGEIDALVRYEAEQHFQSDIKDMYFQYQELDGWSEDARKVPVLMVAAQRDAVDQIIELVRGCGLRTGVIDCESLCLANVFEFSYPRANVLTALIDVGANSSKVTIVYNGQHLFTKNMPFGGGEYTRQIMQSLGVEVDNAETMKLAVSQGQAVAPDPMQRVFSDLNQSFVTELHNVLKLYFESSTPIPGVTGLGAIFLVGGGSRILGLEGALSAAFQVPAQSLNPFTRIQVNPKRFALDYLMTQGHVYGIATGLALRKMGDDRS